MAVRADDVDLIRDRSLVELCQAGDEGAFGDLYKRYYQRLLRFCVRRVGSVHEAEEITQEAFARAFSAMPRFAGERRFYPWLTVIAARLCIDSHRRVARAEPTAEVDPGTVDGGQQQIIDNVDLAYLAQAMEQLGPRHREVLDLRETRGWSYQQIADHYNVTMGTVEALLFRARKALRREFMALAGNDGRLAGIPAVAAMLRFSAKWRARLHHVSEQIVPAAAASAMSVAAVAGGFGSGGAAHAAAVAPRHPVATIASAGGAIIATSPASATLNAGATKVSPNAEPRPALVGHGEGDGHELSGNDPSRLSVLGVSLSTDAKLNSVMKAAPR